jgi:hypothetical protein
MIELIRDDKSEKGTHGTFFLIDKTWHSLEPPDLGNKPYESCIPQGEYDLIPFSSPKYGDCYIMVNEDLNVWKFEDSPGRPDDGRFLCLFVHRGNEVENFVGCCGSSHSFDEEEDRLLSSTTASCKEVNRAVVDEASYKLRISHEFE